MTETIKTILLNYAVCAFVGGVLEYIAPERTKKNLRVTIVSVLLFSMFSPIVKNEVSFESFFPQSENSENVSYNALMHTANLVEGKVRSDIKEILINEGIDEYEIYINTSVDENEGVVYLEEIEIEVGKSFESKITALKNKISNEYKEILKVGVKNE